MAETAHSGPWHAMLLPGGSAVQQLPSAGSSGPPTAIILNETHEKKLRDTRLVGPKQMLYFVVVVVVVVVVDLPSTTAARPLLGLR